MTSDQPVTTSPKRQRLIPRVGWFKVYRADTARIRECGASDCRVSTAVLISVWLALVDIANEERSSTFTRSVGIIWKRAGVSRRHTFSALSALVDLGMLGKETHRANPGKFFDENTWTLHQSNLSPLGKQCTRQPLHSASKRAIHLHKGIKNAEGIIKKERSEEEPSSSSALPPAADAERTASNLPECCTWS
jgi:hypothetical protein